MAARFFVERWAAWAPGLGDQAAWQAWLRQPGPLVSAQGPLLMEMPAMMRRRVSGLGRVALQVAYWGQGGSASCPVVFASRYGDVGRCLDLLRQMAVGEALSPASFSMSVHNAIGAMYSIANVCTEPYTAVAAGQETLEAAFVEALGQLANGEPAVLVVYYDEPLPGPFAVFEDGVEFPRAMAYRLGRSEGQGYSLQSLGACQASTSGEVSSTGWGARTDLAVLDFLVSGTASRYVHTVGGRCWEWVRHG